MKDRFYHCQPIPFTLSELTYRRADTKVPVDALVNGFGLPIFANSVDANRRVRTASDDSSSVRCVGQYRRAGRVYGLLVVQGQRVSDYLRAGRPRGRRGSKLMMPVDASKCNSGASQGSRSQMARDRQGLGGRTRPRRALI